MVGNEVSKICTSRESNGMDTLDSNSNVNNDFNGPQAIVNNSNIEIFRMDDIAQVKEGIQDTCTMDKEFNKDGNLQPPIKGVDLDESLSINHLSNVDIIQSNYNDADSYLVSQSEELYTNIDGPRRPEVECNNKESSVRVVYSSLPSRSKRKLEELLHQWSEWHAKHTLPSEEPAESLESGEETYFPALRVGLQNSSAVSFSMDVQVRKRQRVESLPLNNGCSSLYDRGYAVGLASDEGITEERVVDMREAPRCFNCGSYNHPLSECQKPRDNAAVNSARKQFLNKKNQNGRPRAQTRYYQDSPAGKFDGLKPGALSAETRKLLGLGELDPPPWLNRMRELGYPLGYLDSEEEDQPSGITIIGDEESKDVDANKDLPLDVRTPQKKMTVDFPGINAPIPENADQKNWTAPVGPAPVSSWNQSDNNRWSHARASVNNGLLHGVYGPRNHIESQSSPFGLGLSPPLSHYPHNYHPRDSFSPRGVPVPESPRYGSPGDVRRPYLHYNYGSL